MMAPQDYTNLFNTPLAPDEEAQFQAWAAKTGRARDLFDYDMRGAWKAGAGQSDNGHFPDTFKKPNHPTFSIESMYNGTEGMRGGRWVQQGGRQMFFASPTNLQNYSEPELRSYFQRSEPEVQLVIPAPGLDR